MKGAIKHKLFIFLIVLLVLWAGIGCQPGEKAPLEHETTLGLVSNPPSIELLSTSVSLDFPDSLTFGLKCRGESEISEIELDYEIVKLRSAFVCIWPEFIPARKVQTSWTWDTRKSSLPPGAQIKYRWVVEDADGEVLCTRWGQFTFSDLRHDWREISSNKIRILWYQGDKIFAESLLSAARGILDRLARDVGAELKREAKIYIYASPTDLQSALVFPQEWTGGVAFTNYSTIAIGISPTEFSWGKRALAHELTHLVIHQITYGPFTDLPTWLDEGLAVYAEGDLRPRFRNALERSIADNNLLSVHSLSSFPADPEEAILAYAQSFSIVKYLIDEYGNERMINLLRVFKGGSTPDEALKEVYRFDTSGLERDWRESVGLGSGEAYLRYHPLLQDSHQSSNDLQGNYSDKWTYIQYPHSGNNSPHRVENGLGYLIHSSDKPAMGVDGEP